MRLVRKIISKKTEKLLFSDHQKPVEKVNEERISEVRHPGTRKILMIMFLLFEKRPIIYFIYCPGQDIKLYP